MQTTVNITPEIMNWIIKRIQFENLSESVAKNIQLWMDRTKSPTFNQVEALSKATNIPLGYFFLQTPPSEDLSLLEYRTMDSYELQNPSRNLVDIIHGMENVQEWMRSYLIEMDSSALRFVGSAKNNENAQTIAEMMRSDLGLEIDWFTHSKDAWESFKKIRKCGENIGILIMMNGIVGNNTHRKLNINEFRAFTLIDHYAPLLFINSNDSPNGKLFSLVHEMAHIWLGNNNVFNDRFGTATNVSYTETLCNAIAAELLVPQTLFIQKWGQQSQYVSCEDRIRNTASYFRCGITVIARKALTNKLINKQLYNKIAQTAILNFNALQEKKQEKATGGGNYYSNIATRIDNRFLNALANSVQEGRTLYTDAFRLTNTNRTTFINLIEKIRGGTL